MVMTRAVAWGQALGWPDLCGAEHRVSLAADPNVSAVIARSLQLEHLASLEADLTLRPWLDGVEIDGRVVARMTRLCGVSLEPFDVEIDEPMRIRVVPAGSPSAPDINDGEVVIDLDAEDPPDEATGSTVDLSAYVVEALALALDPFPRKPGAVFTPPEDAVSLSPFAALSRLAARTAED